MKESNFWGGQKDVEKHVLEHSAVRTIDYQLPS